MNVQTPVGGELETAFRSFERAAVQLEQRHAALHTKAEDLERRLLDANRRLETLLDTIDSGVAVIGRDGVLLRSNRAFRRLALHDRADRLRHPALLELLTGAGGRPRTTRLTLDAHDGTREFSVTLVGVEDEDESRVVTLQDVTDVRREEEEGGRRRRLEALGRMAAELAHEVRNPVGSIRLFASLLREDLGGQDEQREMADQILAAASGLEATVSNLLSFASPTRGEFREVDVAELAREVCGLFKPGCAARGVSLEAPTNGPHFLEGDGEGVRQILLNLVGNAMAATDEGGRIRVAVARTDGSVGITVTDDGKGIAAEDLGRVFDPFFSRTAGGTGLGLSIVHGIVDRHAGRITLDSRPGHGTRVSLRIPARRADGEPHA